MKAFPQGRLETQTIPVRIRTRAQAQKFGQQQQKHYEESSSGDETDSSSESEDEHLGVTAAHAKKRIRLTKRFLSHFPFNKNTKIQELRDIPSGIVSVPAFACRSNGSEKRNDDTFEQGAPSFQL